MLRGGWLVGLERLVVRNYGSVQVGRHRLSDREEVEHFLAWHPPPAVARYVAGRPAAVGAWITCWRERRQVTEAAWLAGGKWGS